MTGFGATNGQPNLFKTGKKNLDNHLVFQSFLRPKQIAETSESGKYHLKVSLSLVLISLLGDFLKQIKGPICIVHSR